MIVWTIIIIIYCLFLYSPFMGNDCLSLLETKASYDLTYNLTKPVGDTIQIFVSIVLGLCASFYLSSVTILLLKLNSFASLHSSDRVEMTKKYKFFAFCVSLTACASLISFAFSIPQQISTFMNNPLLFTISTFIELLSEILFSLSVLLILKPKKAKSSVSTKNNHITDKEFEGTELSK